VDKLYRFYWNCGRMGYIDGMFIADEQEVESKIGSRVYFGEVLGKHSDISGKLDQEDLSILSEDQDKIVWLKEVTGGNNTVSGYNPLEYIEDYEDDDEYEEEED